MVWLLVLTFMVGKVGADDVVSFEDGFASNRRLYAYDKDDLVDKRFTLHEKNGAETEYAIANAMETGDMSDMENFCNNFVAHIDDEADHSWRNVGTGYGDNNRSGRTFGGSLNTNHDYGQGGAFGLAWNQDGYYPNGVGGEGHAKMAMLAAGDAASDSGQNYTWNANHTAGHSSTNFGATWYMKNGTKMNISYGHDTSAISRHDTFKSIPVDEYRTDGRGEDFPDDPYQPTRRLSTKNFGNFSLDEPTERDNKGLENGPSNTQTFYNPEIHRLVNEKTTLDGTVVNYKEEIAARCEGFLKKLETASASALSSVRQWMSETEKIRDIARSNCLAGQDRQDHHQKLRQTAITGVSMAVTNMNNAMANLRSKQLEWCAARDFEMDSLVTEYATLMGKINDDITQPAFQSADPSYGASTNLRDWDYKAVGSEGTAFTAGDPFAFSQIHNGYDFQDNTYTAGLGYKNIDVFADKYQITDADGQIRNTQSAFQQSNSVASSNAASHMNKRHGEIQAARQAIVDMVNDARQSTSFNSLDAFYVDPTKRTWNILCDVLKVCKKNDITKIVRVSRGAGLAVNKKMGVKAGAVENIDALNQCSATSATNCLNGYLTSYCEGTSEHPLGSCNSTHKTKVLDTSDEPPSWGAGITDCADDECDVYQNVPCASIEGAIDAGGYAAGDAAVRQAVEEAVCVDEVRCGVAGYANACNDDVPATRREKVVKHCSTWTDENIRTKRLQYAKLEATTEHVISASAQSYLEYFQASKAKMKKYRDDEYDALEAMEIAQSSYIDRYLEHAEALRKANEENQFFMEMVMEAEMMRLAYDQFQHTVTTAQVAAQMTYTADEKALYQAHQVGAEFGATCFNDVACVTVPGTSTASTRNILRKSAMYSTTNKWFGLAQQNLEALIDDSDVIDACCNGGTAGGSWNTCPEPACDEHTKHTSPTTEFQPSQESIPAGQCVCTLLRDAAGQAQRVQAERRAAIQLLKYMSYNLKNTTAVQNFCNGFTWCQSV